MANRSQGDRIKELLALREEIKADAKKLDIKKKAQTTLEQEMIEELDAAGVRLSSTAQGTASITEEIKGSIEDRIKAEKWMKQNKCLHLLTNHISNAAFNEILNSRRGHKPPPGFRTFTVRKLSLRKIS